MSTRCNFRRKIVLALHVVRCSTGEKQLAHTLDIAGTSARLAGLRFLLEQDEVVEIRRGAAKAQFEVVWMGAPGSSLKGQAGIRSMEPDKNVWGGDFPKDQRDQVVSTELLRQSAPQVHQARSTPKPGGKRTHERYPCSGIASIRTTVSVFALHGEVKDISEGGVYVELLAPLPVNTDVTVGLKIEGTWIEFAGNVRTSYPMLGMGIAFNRPAPANREKLIGLLEALKRRDATEMSEYIVELGASQTLEVSENKAATPDGTQTESDTYPLSVLTLACRDLADNLEAWKDHYSEFDLEELRKAISLLQEKLSPSQPVQQTESLPVSRPE